MLRNKLLTDKDWYGDCLLAQHAFYVQPTSSPPSYLSLPSTPRFLRRAKLEKVGSLPDVTQTRDAKPLLSYRGDVIREVGANVRRRGSKFGFGWQRKGCGQIVQILVFYFLKSCIRYTTERQEKANQHLACQFLGSPFDYFTHTYAHVQTERHSEKIWLFEGGKNCFLFSFFFLFSSSLMLQLPWLYDRKKEGPKKGRKLISPVKTEICRNDGFIF